MAKWLGPFIWNSFKALKSNLSDGYNFGDISAAWAGFDRNPDDSTSTQSASDIITDTVNNHGLDENGNLEVNPADPTSSASNVIEYDPNKSALDNIYDYAIANNSASAYSDYLNLKHSQDLSNNAIGRAIEDAERNGISKYQLFQSGNAAAASPSSGSSLASSYENAMNRRNSWNEKELAAIVAIVTAAINSAGKVMSK